MSDAGVDTAAAPTAGMAERDRRAVLWLCCAAVCWRWLVGRHTPMPDTTTCEQLWLARQLAARDFAVLAGEWWRALPALLLAPLLAVGAPAVASAKVLAALAGGLAVAPAALAAERLRQGAGVGAAVVVAVAGAAVLGAGGGAPSATASLLIALALWAAAARRWSIGVLLGAVAAPQLIGEAGARSWWQAWLVLGPAVATLPWLLLRPRSWAFAVPAAALASGVVVGLLRGDLPTAGAAVAPALGVLVGVVLARLGRWWRDGVLCVVVAAQCHAAWSAVEPSSAVAERILAQYLVGSVLGPGERLVTDLPRVAWAAGGRPVAMGSAAELRAAVDDVDVGAVVLGGSLAADPSLRTWLASRFAVVGMSADLEDLAAARHLVVLVRRS
ncbi:MAG: hypothetical protein R3F29_04240 [Planctomycetota bacterium]